MINYSNNLINSNIVQGKKKIEPQKKLHDSFSLKKKKIIETILRSYSLMLKKTTSG